MTEAGTSSETLPEGYRMTELGPLPKEWRVVRLGVVFEEVGERVKDSIYPHAAELPVLSLTKNEGLILQSDRFGKRIATKDVSKYKVVRQGQIVYNPYVIWEGAIHILSKFEAGIVSPVYPVLQAKRDIAEPYFLDAWLRTPPAIEAYNRFAAGAVNRRRAIRKQDFWQIEIPLPPLPEQRAIAHVLRTVQESKEATERVIGAVRELKKSLLRHLFTYGPVPVDQVNQVEMQETEIGPIPAHWRVVKLGEVYEIQQGKALSRKKNKGIRPRPFLRTANVLWGKVDLSNLDQMDFSEKEEQKYVLQSGDLLICEGGEIGRTAMWDGQLAGIFYQNHIFRVRAILSKIHPPFHMYWMQTAIGLFGLYQGRGNKTTIPNLSKRRLAEFPIPLPPLPEQQDIARILQMVDRKMEAEEAKRKALEELFRSLLHELMTARRRLPAQFVTQFEEKAEVES